MSPLRSGNAGHVQGRNTVWIAGGVQRSEWWGADKKREARNEKSTLT